MLKSAVAALVAGAAMTTLSEYAAAQESRTNHPGDRVHGEHFAGRSPVVARNGMAATAQPLASQVAIDVLKAGGNAVDAAIAANAAIGLMEPTGNGIGGDIFVLVYDPETQTVYGLNGSGRSPQDLSYDEMVERLGAPGPIPPTSALSVSVPGTVDGWFTLHERFGSLPMSDILQPAIDYAEAGFPVSPTIAYFWDRNMRILGARHEAGELVEFDNARATYLTEDGDAPQTGEMFRNPDLAASLRLIAEGGRDAFYEGPIARTIADYLGRVGGALTLEDFAAHRSEWVEPLSVNYRGYDVWELPPPGQGVTALQMLQILEGFDLASMGFMSADAIHVMIEAKRLAYEDRARFFADPDFTDFPGEALISEAYAEERRALISMDQAIPQTFPGDPAAIEHGDTTYLTVADADGMMVSLIQSNFRGMGTGLVPDGLGFMLQNRGELFSFDPDHPNVYAPGKRPFHTIIPALVTKDGEGWLSFGVMGGAMQPQGHVQILANIIDFGLNVQEAGDAARWRHDGSIEPTDALGQGETMGEVFLESGVPEAVREALAAKGHAVNGPQGFFGGYQAIRRDPETGVLFGATEMRVDGAAQGY